MRPIGWFLRDTAADNRERINELYTSHKKKGTLGGSKATAGATVDAKGKLIWD